MLAPAESAPEFMDLAQGESLTKVQSTNALF